MEKEVPKTKLSPSNPVTTPSGIRVKGQRKVWHHLFKSDVQKMKKNVSFKKGQPKIEELDHTHVFHNINSQFKPQTITQISCGHFHEVKWEMKNGVPVITHVGPPMRYGYVQRPAGQKRVAQKVAWFDGNEEKEIVDNHRHTFAYIHSEELSEETLRNVQHDTAQAIASQMKTVGLEEAVGS